LIGAMEVGVARQAPRLERTLERTIDTVRASPHVSGAIAVGSLAAGTSDEVSNVDLIW
jgi:hypothetical protein